MEEEKKVEKEGWIRGRARKGEEGGKEKTAGEGEGEGRAKLALAADMHAPTSEASLGTQEP